MFPAMFVSGIHLGRISPLSGIPLVRQGPFMVTILPSYDFKLSSGLLIRSIPFGVTWV